MRRVLYSVLIIFYLKLYAFVSSWYPWKRARSRARAIKLYFSVRLLRLAHSTSPLAGIWIGGQTPSPESREQRVGTWSMETRGNQCLCQAPPPTQTRHPVSGPTSKDLYYLLSQIYTTFYTSQLMPDFLFFLTLLFTFFTLLSINFLPTILFCWFFFY